MLTLPSMWNLIVSTIVFFIVVWYANRHLDAQGITQGRARSISVFALAYLLSWGAGELVDWTQGPQPAAQTANDLSQLLKVIGQAQQ